MDVFIVGVGMTALGKHLDKSVKQLTAEAVNAALARCGRGGATPSTPRGSPIPARVRSKVSTAFVVKLP